MTSMFLSQAAEKIQATFIGEDVSFSSVSTDTRKISRGDLYVALRGERFDGHDYAAQAFAKGAVAVMVSRPVEEQIPQIRVKDTRSALGRLARAWRLEVDPTIVALTGSNGKTTLKEMLAAIFSENHEVLATQGNLNNDIGVPLTLLRLQQQEIAIVEMGANHVGEIDYLTHLAMPDVAILNNAGRAHIGEFGSEENIARAKAEILNGLKTGGVFVYNADSQWAVMWKEMARKVKSVSFGVAENADYRGMPACYRMVWSDTGYRTEFDVYEAATRSQFTISLSLAGWHNAMNALAAVAAARTLGVEWQVIQCGLAKIKPVPGRLNPLAGANGQLVIDDAYNANPDSVAAAVDVLVTAPGRKILVLGDLAELGEASLTLHAGLGSMASEKGVDVLYTCGGDSHAASDHFDGKACHYETREQLISALQQETGGNDYILVKGSRSSGMDRVVAALCCSNGSTGGGESC